MIAVIPFWQFERGRETLIDWRWMMMSREPRLKVSEVDVPEPSNFAAHRVLTPLFWVSASAISPPVGPPLCIGCVHCREPLAIELALLVTADLVRDAVILIGELEPLMLPDFAAEVTVAEREVPEFVRSVPVVGDDDPQRIVEPPGP